MSRIGKKPIPLPKGVTVKIAGDAVEVQGPKGKMRQVLPPGVVFAQDNGALVATLEYFGRVLVEDPDRFDVERLVEFAAAMVRIPGAVGSR